MARSRMGNNFMENHLHDLIREEEFLSQWLLKIQLGLKASLIQDAKAPESEDDTDAHECEQLANEVEKALSLAKLAIESSSGKLSTKCISPISKRVDNQSNAPVHPRTSTDSPKEKLVGSIEKKASDRSLSALRYRPAYTTAPYQTFKERPKSARRPVGNSALICKSKALCRSIVEKTPSATKNNPSDSFPPNCIQTAPSSVLTLPNIKDKPKSQVDDTVTFHLDAKVKKRVDQVRLASENMDRIASLLKADQESVSKRKLLEHLERLGVSENKEPDVPLMRLSVALTLPKVASLFEEFLKMHDTIDWEIATAKQRAWRQTVLASFRGLFTAAWQLKPLLLTAQNSPDGGDQELEAPPLMPPDTPVASAESEPTTLDTIWRAYVCAGEDTDPATPRSALSRGHLLSVGPTIFQSASPADLEDLLGTWQDIMHTQRELERLSFFEEHLPQWLHQLSQQGSNQASTFRAICGLVLGRPPVALASESLQ